MNNQDRFSNNREVIYVDDDDETVEEDILKDFDMDNYEYAPPAQRYIRQDTNITVEKKPVSEDETLIDVNQREEIKANIDKIIEKEENRRKEVLMSIDGYDEDITCKIASMIVESTLDIQYLRYQKINLLDIEGLSPTFRKVETLLLPDMMKKANKSFGELMPRLRLVISGSLLEEIGNYAFTGHKGLTGFSSNRVLKRVGEEAFNDCVSLKDIVLPTTITEIGRSAFYNCAMNLLDLDVRECKLNSFCFSSCRGLKRVTISGKLEIDTGTFKDCQQLQKVNMYDCECRRIPSLMFSGCFNLSEITLPSKISSIGSFAFEGCNSIAEMTLPPSLKDLDSDAFNNASITELNIEGDIEIIGDRAFQECNIGNGLEVPTSVVSIGDMAFDTMSIRSIDLTKCSRLMYIGNDALYSNNLLRVTLPDDPFSRHYYDYGERHLTTLRLPTSLTCINNKEIDEYYHETQEVTYYPSGEIIGTGSLNGMYARNIRIYDGKEIQSYALVGDNTVTNVEIPDSVKYISRNAFVGNPNLRSVRAPRRYTFTGLVLAGNPHIYYL